MSNLQRRTVSNLHGAVHGERRQYQHNPTLTGKNWTELMAAQFACRTLRGADLIWARPARQIGEHPAFAPPASCVGPPDCDSARRPGRSRCSRVFDRTLKPWARGHPGRLRRAGSGRPNWAAINSVQSCGQCRVGAVLSPFTVYLPPCRLLTVPTCRFRHRSGCRKRHLRAEFDLGRLIAGTAAAQLARAAARPV